MGLKLLRFIVLLWSAVTMGLALSHTFVMPVKLGLSAESYILVQSIYRDWGVLGGLFEGGTLLLLLPLVWVLRRRGRTFILTLGALVCSVLMMAVFLLVVNPANQSFALWVQTVEPPANWVMLRDQWEYGHAFRSLLAVLGFSLLLAGVIRETPD